MEGRGIYGPTNSLEWSEMILVTHFHFHFTLLCSYQGFKNLSKYKMLSLQQKMASKDA